jgi:sugar phosphate isomerase/epimerase
MVKRIGFSSCCFPEEMPIEEILEFCLAHDFNAMELAVNSTNFDPPNVKASALEQIKELSHSGRIYFGLHGPENINFSDPRAEAREEWVRKMEEALHFSATLGVKSVVVHPGRIIGEVTPEKVQESVVQNVSGIRRCALRAKELGVIPSVENLCHEKGTVNPTIDSFMAMCKAIDLSLIGITFDTNHAGLVDGLEKTISVIGPYVNTIHFSSNKGQKSDHCPPQEGVIDFYTIAGFLRAFDGLTIIELNEIGKESASAILRTREYLIHLLNAGPETAGGFYA